MKKWIQRDFGRPGYQYTKRIDGTKKKKTFDFRIPCTYGELSDCSVSAFNLLSLVQTAEEFYGTELRNIQLVMHCVPEKGHGEDREAAYVQYYITFEKLETDEEMALREKREQEEDDKANKKKLELEQKEKELLLTYLEKYGDIREGQYKYLNIFINGEEFENINGSKAYWEGNSFDKIVTDIVKVIEKQRKDVVYSLSVMESIPYKTQMESLKTFRNENKETIKEMLKQKIIYYDYSTPKVYYPNGYEKNYVNQPWGTCPPVEPYYTVSYQNHT